MESKVDDLEAENRFIETKCQDRIDTIKGDNDELSKKVNKLEALLKRCGKADDGPKNSNQISEQERELEREKSEIEEQREKNLKKSQELENEKKTFHDKMLELEADRRAYDDLTKTRRFKACISNPEPPEDLIEKIESFKQENVKLKDEKLKLENELRRSYERESHLENNIKDCKENSKKSNCENYDEEISVLKADVSGCRQTLKCCEKQQNDFHESLNKCKNSLNAHKEFTDINSRNCKAKLNTQYEASNNRREFEIKLSNLSSNFDKIVRINSDLTYQLEKTDCQDCQKKLKNSNFDLKLCHNELDVFLTFPLECKFAFIDSQYTCIASNIICNHRSMRISATHGNHQDSKSNFNIEKLQIIDSIFKFITNDIFEQFQNLISLEIINSQLTDLNYPNIESNSLIHIQIEGNKIQKIKKDSFGGVTELHELILINNDIENLENGAFNGLSKLKKLDLKTNKIYELPTGIFNDLKALTHLSVAENRIKSLDDGGLLRNSINLQVLKANENPIEYINAGILSYTRLVKKLDFNGTCAGNDFNGDESVGEIKRKIIENCKYLK